jgi:hypothetical protein
MNHFSITKGDFGSHDKNGGKCSLAHVKYRSVTNKGGVAANFDAVPSDRVTSRKR